MELFLLPFSYPTLYLFIGEIQFIHLLLSIHVQQVCYQLLPVYRNEVACTYV